MKAMMGFGFFLLFLAGIALVMLQGRELASQNLPGGGSGMAGIDWRPVSLGDMAVAPNTNARVTFTVDGKVGGNAGCNQFFGTLKTTDDGVEMSEMGVSRKMCPPEIMEIENAFLDVLKNTARFAHANDSMRMLDADGETLASFVAVEGAGD